MDRLTFKHGESFAVLDRAGDAGVGEQGLYHCGTRRLSRLGLAIDGRPPELLAGGLDARAPLATADLAAANQTIHMRRTQFLWRGAFHASLRLQTYGMAAVAVEIALLFAADFADVFEVRGFHRPRSGRLWSAIGTDRVVLGCDGLDGVVRRTVLAFSLPPTALAADSARFVLRLEPGRAVELVLAVSFDEPSAAASAGSFAAALDRLRADAAARRVRVATSDRGFDRWLERSAADLRMLETATPHGPYPYAGVPWFSTMFGRDAILTALACLWLDPAPARAVLLSLAETQATAHDPRHHAEPGRILHERRDGEMAALGEIPYGLTYASADATPLFLMLAAETWRRTADRPLMQALWPHLERALEWIDRWGDRDGDGFVEYGHPGPQTEADRDWKQGLANQGWKDSEDAVMHADGGFADGPIALVEVQAYVYAGKLGAADVAESLGRTAESARLRDEAAALRVHFEQAFWLEDKGTYALALDGGKRPCRVAASNAGHVLFCGIAGPERARRLADTLMSPAMFSGWGVRTLAEGERRYNPMSYHNGAIWPHDTAIVAAGLARYGLTGHAGRLLDGTLAAAEADPSGRLPELFCGFARQAGLGPVPAPVACSPQAWSAAAVFLLLQAVLGLEVAADPPVLRFRAPILPGRLARLDIAGLVVGDATVDVAILRRPHGVGVEVTGDGVTVAIDGAPTTS